MNKKFWFVAIASILLFSCSDVGTDSPAAKNKSGSIAFSLAKNTIPNEVGIVEVRLERSGYAPITNTAFIGNFIDTVKIKMNNIPIGTWQLTIDAKDSSGHLRYTGSTSVTIIENATVLAFVHMDPVGSGVGSVQIFVTWQSQQFYLQIQTGNDSLFFISQPIPIVAHNISQYELMLAMCCFNPDWRIQQKVDSGWTPPGECERACPAIVIPPTILQPGEATTDSIYVSEPGHYRIMVRYTVLSPISSKKPKILEAYSNEFFVAATVR